MKIIYDHQIFMDQVYGGPSRYFIKIIEEILKSENIKISTTLHINSYLKDLPSENIAGFNLNKIFFQKLPYGIRKILINRLINKINIYYLGNLIKNFKPDIIHRTNFEDYNTNLPVVLTVYDLIHEKYSDLYGNDKNFRPKKKAIERADEIICISKNTLDDLEKYYNLKNKKTSVIYLGWQLIKKNKIDQNSISFDNNFLLYVGKRSGYKNFLNFIKAYSISEKLKKNFKIFCFGGGNFNKSEIDLFRELKIDQKNIQYFEGHDTLLINLYKKATALIYPSKYEGFGLPVLEAMSFDCPVVCSDSSSIPEVGGNAVEYFNPESVENIEQTICNVVFSKHKIKELKKLGNERVKLFNWSKCAEETLNIYKKLI